MLALLLVGFGLFRFAAPRMMAELPLDRATNLSVTVVDRHDQLLRAFTTPDGLWRLPLDLAEVDPRYVAMLLAFEDRRFRSHGGVDAVGVARAATQFVRYRRLVSGASTITMQVARLLTGEHERTGIGKLRQMARAWQLERRFTKDEILNLYLRLAPFGGNVEGVRAASLTYFGKEPRRLSIGEAALLVALPQSPGIRRPDRNANAARRGRDNVLARARTAGLISADEEAAARREPIPNVRREFPKLAPHLAESELARAPELGVHRTTLDAAIQAQLEALAREHAAVLGPKLSVALMAVEHQTGRVIAHVGSAGYLDEARQGAIDMTDAVRSPGSTLKPLIYGLGFEAGILHPETLIEDRPTRFGLYNPKNFDEDFRGTVTIREALAHSLNIPAVKVLAALGPQRLTGRLKRSGIISQLPPGTEPTLAIALGGVGLRLRDLAQLYAALARGGQVVDLTHLRDAGSDVGVRSSRSDTSGTASPAGTPGTGSPVGTSGTASNPVTGDCIAAGTFLSPSRGGVRGGGIELAPSDPPVPDRSPQPRPLPVKGRGDTSCASQANAAAAGPAATVQPALTNAQRSTGSKTAERTMSDPEGLTPTKRGRRLLTPVASWYVADILKDAPAPANARAGRIAYKTGTSYGFRDAWAAGFDGRTTIVVWVGRPDGTPVPGLTGRTAAAPILFDAFHRLGDRVTPLPPPPHGVLRQSASALPLPLRRFKDAGEPPQADGAFIEPPVAIAFPPDRSDIDAETGSDGIVLKAEGGALPLTWLVDGEPLEADPDRRDIVWHPQGRGFAKISVIDAKGRSDRVEVRLK